LLLITTLLLFVSALASSGCSEHRHCDIEHIVILSLDSPAISEQGCLRGTGEQATLTRRKQAECVLLLQRWPEWPVVSTAVADPPGIVIAASISPSVIAHRAPANAPENTLAAFRLAAAERADFVELDVQETIDGIVVVNHDSDLMKLGRSPMKIWEHTHDELHTVDIGSYFGPQFKNERVATLTGMAACKGSKILVG
jgi:hypothetical protein